MLPRASHVSDSIVNIINIFFTKYLRLQLVVLSQLSVVVEKIFKTLGPFSFATFFLLCCLLLLIFLSVNGYGYWLV